MIHFITPAQKAKYLKDFKENVLTCTDKVWKLDNGLEKICAKINNNPNVQTIYSKRNIGLPSTGTSPARFLGVSDYVSYIIFSVTENVSIDAINHIKHIMTDRFGNKVFCGFQDGTKSKSFINDLNLNMGCTKDVTYWNIPTFSIYLDVKDVNEHNEFWKMVDDTIYLL